MSDIDRDVHITFGFTSEQRLAYIDQNCLNDQELSEYYRLMLTKCNDDIEFYRTEEQKDSEQAGMGTWPRFGEILVAIPDTDWAFSEWEGDASDDDNPLSVRMDSDKNFTAVFVPLCAVSTTVLGQGAIELIPEQGPYPAGAEIEVSAAPATDWVFTGWSGDATGSENPAFILSPATSQSSPNLRS